MVDLYHTVEKLLCDRSGHKFCRPNNNTKQYSPIIKCLLMINKNYLLSCLHESNPNLFFNFFSEIKLNTQLKAFFEFETQYWVWFSIWIEFEYQCIYFLLVLFIEQYIFSMGFFILTVFFFTVKYYTNKFIHLFYFILYWNVNY